VGESEQVHRWPRVLLLSDEGPQTSSAGGILLFRLLQDYPPDRLRVIERRLEPDVQRLACRYDALKTPWRRFEGSRFNRSKRSLRAFGLVPPVPLRRIDALLDGFVPEVVLSVMQGAACYDAAWRYAAKHRLPLVAVVHDVNEEFEPVLPFAVRAMRRRDGNFYRYAAKRLCVSPEMEALCAELYGVRGEVLYPNRSKELSPRPLGQTLTLKSADRLSLGFVGNLAYGYGDELLRLLPALRAANVRLVIYSAPPGDSLAALLAATDCVDFRGFAPAMAAWRAIQAECDAVILPYSHASGRLERLVRHHFPSKLPEYLALGLPVMVSGPEYATGVAWGLRNPTAVMTCTSTGLNSIAAKLESLRVDPALRLSLATTGLAAGLRDFDPCRIQFQFLQAIRQAHVRYGASDVTIPASANVR
jgi:glycosyltransferase involved in cell wall biosynthesis